MKNIFLILIFGWILVGCAQPPTTAQLESANYGQEIGQEEAEKIIKSWFQKRLKDPYSAQYEFQKPYKGYVAQSPLIGEKNTHYGYMCNVGVNGKNSYGGYTGMSAYKFLINNGYIVFVLEKDAKSGNFLPAQ